MNRENAATITNTGGHPTWPKPSGIFAGGNHRSHCATRTGRCSRRSAGSAGAYSGRIAATRSRNHDIDPDQPTRSAITVAGICGYTDNNARILGSAALIADSTGARSYRGGPSLASAAATVLRATPSCLAIARCDNFSL